MFQVNFCASLYFQCSVLDWKCGHFLPHPVENILNIQIRLLRIYLISIGKGCSIWKTRGGAGSRGFIPPPSPTGRFWKTSEGGSKWTPIVCTFIFKNVRRGYISSPTSVFLSRKTPLNMFFRVQNSPFLDYLVNFGPYITFFSENWLRSPQPTFFG